MGAMKIKPFTMENGMRHYYEEWGRWLNRLPSDP